MLDLARSVASAYSIVSASLVDIAGKLAYKLQDTNGSGLVFSALGEVEQTLASLARPGSSGVRDLWLLATKIAAETLGGDGLISKEEVLLGEDDAPVTSKLAIKFAEVVKNIEWRTSRDQGP